MNTPAIITTPTTTTSVRVVSPKIETDWQPAFQWLARSDIQAYGDGELGLVRFRHCRLVLDEVIRLKWDSKFRSGEKSPTVHRPLEKLEGELWYRVLNLIQEIFLLGIDDIYPHPSLRFTCVFQERHMGLFDAPEGKQKALDQIRSENRQLRDLSNPIDPDRFPHTHGLIEQATATSENLDRFRTRHYMPMVKARQALTTFHAKNSTVFKQTKEGVFFSTGRGKGKLKT